MFKGLATPWSLAFLPNGDMLITEKAGKLRIVRGGTLDPQPVAGTPEVFAVGQGGLLEVAVHPQFAQNQFVYLTYSKGKDARKARRRWRAASFDGKALVDSRTSSSPTTGTPAASTSDRSSRSARTACST